MAQAAARARRRWSLAANRSRGPVDSGDRHRHHVRDARPPPEIGGCGVAYGASDRGDPDGTLCKSGVELTVGSMQHIRTFHMDWEATLAGSEPGEVEYAI